MKILLTAFDPFGEDTVNPALEAVKCVNPDNVPAELVKLEVPTVFYRSLEVVRDAIDKEQPDVVLAIGQAGGRFGLTPERVAINQDDARITDNDGGQPIDTPVVEGGPAAYFATIPIKAMVQAMQDAGLPAQISNSAGTFVCNHLMYGILHALAEDGRGARGGFMHVPFIPEQVTTRKDTASMALADITRGIEVALTAIVENATDIKVQGGAIS